MEASQITTCPCPQLRSLCFTSSGKSAIRAQNQPLLLNMVRVKDLGARLTVFLIFLTIMIGSGCAPKQQPSGATRAPSGSSQDLFEAGDEVFGSGTDIQTNVDPAVGTASRPEDTPGEWSVALLTISGEDHQAIAKSARRDIVDRFEGLDEIFVDQVKGGSAIFYGRFESPSDPGFRVAIEKIRSITLDDGIPAFPRVFPARPLSGLNANVDPHDIRTLRVQLGDRHPVYSLQVAQWGTFGDEGIDYASMRARAVRNVKTLRSRGFDAWFSHNSGKRLSSVNIGVFGPDAYDPRSTLFAPEVELLMGQFPQLLVNGEPLLDPRTGKSRKPFLVEVPR